MVAAASPVTRCSRSVTTSAPALMNGLRGRPCSWSSCSSELNGLPDGSRDTLRQISSPSCAITRARLKTLEMLCTEKRVSQSPTAWTWPSFMATTIPNWWGSTRASPGM